MNWSTYFMRIAETVSIKSKDPNTRVGAVLVDRDMRIVSTGFNGFPPGVTESADLWQRPTKYSKVVHAEANAILYGRRDFRGCYLYTTLQPCCECLKLIAGAGIAIVFFKNQLREAAESYELARFFGIDMRQMEVEIESTANVTTRP